MVSFKSLTIITKLAQCTWKLICVINLSKEWNSQLSIYRVHIRTRRGQAEAGVKSGLRRRKSHLEERKLIVIY